MTASPFPRARTSRPRGSWVLGILWAGVGFGGFLAPGSWLGAQDVGDDACLLCHARPELMRRQAETPERARALVVDREALDRSAHAGMACGDCHAGYGGFPHPAGAATRGCGEGGCHGIVNEPWSGSVHARIQEGTGVEAARCVACHGVHDVPSADAMEVTASPAMIRMNQACEGCHSDQALPTDAAHRDAVLCASCHAPHATGAVAHPDSWIAPSGQVETCGACHQDAALAFRPDAHGTLILRGDSLAPIPGSLAADSAAPVCTTCHGAHPMPDTAAAGFRNAMVERCGGCHQDLASRYYDSYHGKAVRLGSEAAAACWECHLAHGVYPQEDPRSSVAQASLVETCGVCHENSRPAFVQYDSHPDFTDRERNPILFYSFWFMTALVVGTLTVFVIHTLLWWIRIGIDMRRGGGHHA